MKNKRELFGLFHAYLDYEEANKFQKWTFSLPQWREYRNVIDQIETINCKLCGGKYVNEQAIYNLYDRKWQLEAELFQLAEDWVKDNT